MVRGLEEQYDEFVRGQEGTNLLAEQTGPLPTADELGAELERYLAEQPRPNDPPPRSLSNALSTGTQARLAPSDHTATMTDAGSPSGPDLQAELARLNQQVETLRVQAAEAHQNWVRTDAVLRATAQRRDQLAASVRVLGTGWGGPGATGGPGPQPAAAPVPGPFPTATAAVPETSTRTVQNLLFVLGGILLGTAAIVFTAVAWTTFGVEGRATILAVFTLIALALPFIALWPIFARPPRHSLASVSSSCSWTAGLRTP